MTLSNRAARTVHDIECWLTDMDGVLVHENHALKGASELLQYWRENNLRFLVLTNNSIYTPRDLRARLLASGLDVPEENIWTSAMATAEFLARQRPGGRTFVIGEAGLTTALHDAGFIMTDQNPDYVVLGETRTYSFEAITKAIRLIEGGAKFEDQARLNSEDASSAKGGDLGWVSAGDLVPDFQVAMDQLKPGELSQPVRSPFGWHLIEVIERRDQDVSKDRQREQARLALRQRKADEQFAEFVRQTRDRAYVEIKADER